MSKSYRNPRCTDEEKDRRVNTVYEMMCNGYSRTEMIRYITEKYGVKIRQAEIYLKKARELLKEDLCTSRQEYAVELLAQLRDIKRRATRDRQYHAAIMAVDRMGSMVGVQGLGKNSE